MKTRGVAPAADPIRQGSRDRVLAVLREASQPMGISQICAATRLSPNAVRFHLDHLIGLGAVHSVKDPHASGSGRPALLYSAFRQDAESPEPVDDKIVHARILAIDGHPRESLAMMREVLAVVDPNPDISGPELAWMYDRTAEIASSIGVMSFLRQ